MDIWHWNNANDWLDDNTEVVIPEANGIGHLHDLGLSVFLWVLWWSKYFLGVK